MCESCGCAAHDARGAARTITVNENLMAANDRIAAHVREHFDALGVLVINLMSSPGAGKTSLLEATIAALPPEVNIAVIEGDLETENDAERIRRRGVKAVQITTGVACHLDAAMIHDALRELPLDAIDVLFIENVGNLVCPADFDIGQHLNVVLLSVPEGDDKPEKYPVMFRNADLVLITKTDLLPYVGDFDMARATRAIDRLSGGARVEQVSVRTSQGLEAWTSWLAEQCEAARQGGLAVAASREGAVRESMEAASQRQAFARADLMKGPRSLTAAAEVADPYALG